MPTAIVLIRHGDYLHHTDPAGTEAACDGGLSPWGRRQAEALRQRLARTGEIQAQALFCSTLPRARETAALIAPALGLAPQATADLCEWDSGNELLGADKFMQTMRSLDGPARRHHRFWPGFETIDEFARRVKTRLDAIVSAFEGQTVAMVVHGGVVETAFTHFLGYGPGPFEGGYPAVGHTSLMRWERSKTRDDWKLTSVNDMQHLNGLTPAGSAQA